MTLLVSFHQGIHFFHPTTQAVDVFNHLCHFFRVLARGIPVVEEARLEAEPAFQEGGGGVLLLDQGGEPLDVLVRLLQAARRLHHLARH